jgi:hypothetical protein
LSHSFSANNTQVGLVTTLLSPAATNGVKGVDRYRKPDQDLGQQILTQNELNILQICINRLHPMSS